MAKPLELFNDITDVQDNATANFYSLLYRKRPKGKNFSIALPNNPRKTNEEFLKNICESLVDLRDYNLEEYNPYETVDGSYECLNDESLEPIISEFVELNSAERNGLTKENTVKLPLTNLLICDLTFNNKDYYIFMEQDPCDKLLKGRAEFIIGDGKITPINNRQHSFFLKFRIGCVWAFSKSDTEKSLMYIFDRKFFSWLFDYDEHLKTMVANKSETIAHLPFLNNAEIIISKIGQKNVYGNFAKIINDEEYIDKMNTMNPKTLRKRLLERCGDKFTKDDFDKDGKLKVTSASLNKIVKMICKGFKYNAIEDKAEY